jgi:hypothetical protein
LRQRSVERVPKCDVGGWQRGRNRAGIRTKAATLASHTAAAISVVGRRPANDRTCRMSRRLFGRRALRHHGLARSTWMPAAAQLEHSG